MTKTLALDKAEFVKYANALLKNHNVVFRDESKKLVHFPDNSPAELLAHSMFGSEKSTLIVRKDITAIGSMKFQTKRSYTKDCKVIELVDYSGDVEDLKPINLAR